MAELCFHSFVHFGCVVSYGIEVYMSSLEEKLMKIEIPEDKYNNLTSKERQALYDLKNDESIVIKGADKGSAVEVWDRGLHKGSRKAIRG